jgi:hypothetical protein
MASQNSLKSPGGISYYLLWGVRRSRVELGLDRLVALAM